MRAKITEVMGMTTALSALCAAAWCTGVIAQEKLSGKELPQRSEISGITPEVLVRTDVPGAPGKIEIMTRTTYRPGTELRRHYHTSQIVFFILEGSMGVQEDGKEPMTLKIEGMAPRRSGEPILLPRVRARSKQDSGTGHLHRTEARSRSYRQASEIQSMATRF
jgi:hypothetical protein